MSVIEINTRTSEKEINHLLEQLVLFEQGSCTILSIDADGLHASDMEAVSAVNPSGLRQATVEIIYQYYLKHCIGPKILGIYEYNPILTILAIKPQKALVGS